MHAFQIDPRKDISNPDPTYGIHLETNPDPTNGIHLETPDPNPRTWFRILPKKDLSEINSQLIRNLLKWIFVFISYV